MDQLAEQFERDRPRLEAVAQRMLGSRAEADNAVQEAWLRLGRSGGDGVENLSAWLTTVVGRICLDMLRSRTARREDPLEEVPVLPQQVRDPEQEALLGDSVGLALLVVLDTLGPAERLAFVLHDLFAVSFEEIAPIVGRTPSAARQPASRARRRVQADPATDPAHLGRRTELVDAFLAAARKGEFGALLRMLDPDVDFRPDATATAMGGPPRVRGAEAVAGFYNGRAQAAAPSTSGSSSAPLRSCRVPGARRMSRRPRSSRRTPRRRRSTRTPMTRMASTRIPMPSMPTTLLPARAPWSTTIGPPDGCPRRLSRTRRGRSSTCSTSGSPRTERRRTPIVSSARASSALRSIDPPGRTWPSSIRPSSTYRSSMPS